MCLKSYIYIHNNITNKMMWCKLCLSMFVFSVGKIYYIVNLIGIAGGINFNIIAYYL